MFVWLPNLWRIFETMRSIVVVVAALVLFGCAAPKKELAPVYFPPLPDLPRVQFLTNFVSELDVLSAGDRRMAAVLGNTQPLSLRKATDVAFYDHWLYALDSTLGALWRFDLKNRKSKVFQALSLADGSGEFGLVKPTRIVIDTDGNKYIVDSGSGDIVVLNAADQVRTLFKGPEGFRPAGLAVRDGVLWVGDLGSHRIQKLNAVTGEFLGSIGEENELPWPFSLDIDGDGNLVVCDMALFKVLKLSPDGKLLKDFGSPGDRPGQFSRPKGVVVSPDGLIHVVDAGFENVQLFSEDGKLLMFYANAAPPANLFLPMGIAVSAQAVDYMDEYLAPGFKADYIVAVASQFGPARVGLFAFGKLEGEDYSRYDSPPPPK